MNSRLAKVIANMDYKLDDTTACMEAVMLDRLQLEDPGCRMPGSCKNCGYQGTKWVQGVRYLLCLD